MPLTRDEDSNVRRQTVLTLGTIEQPGPRIEEAVLASLEDDDPEVRKAAVHEAQETRETAQRETRELRESAGREVYELRETAAREAQEVRATAQREVENQLTPHAAAEKVPSLQGESERPGQWMSWARSGWSPTAILVAGVSAAAAVAVGTRAAAR